MAKTVLLADDSQTIRTLISMLLGGTGAEIVVVKSGAEALGRLASHAPDLILADMTMDAPNGAAICDAVKANPATRHIPVILLAGAGAASTAAQVRTADAVIAKPFESARLIDAVKEFLARPVAATVAPKAPPARVPEAITLEAPILGVPREESTSAQISAWAHDTAGEVVLEAGDDFDLWGATSEPSATPAASSNADLWGGDFLAEPTTVSKVAAPPSAPSSGARPAPAKPATLVTAPPPTPPSTPRARVSFSDATDPDIDLKAPPFNRREFPLFETPPAAADELVLGDDGLDLVLEDAPVRSDGPTVVDRPAVPFGAEPGFFAASDLPLASVARDEIAELDLQPVDEPWSSDHRLAVSADDATEPEHQLDVDQDLVLDPTPLAARADLFDAPAADLGASDWGGSGNGGGAGGLATTEPSVLPGLDPARLEAIVRDVARSVIERIAWEVVPDLAEEIVRDELKRLTQ